MRIINKYNCPYGHLKRCPKVKRLRALRFQGVATCSVWGFCVRDAGLRNTRSENTENYVNVIGR